MNTKNFNEIVDLFCIEIENKREINNSTEDLIKKISDYSNYKQYKTIDFERDLELIKELIYAKYRIIYPILYEDNDECYKRQANVIRTILQGKAKEYSKEDNRLHNFYLGSQLSKIEPTDVCFGYMLKHICSVYDILVEYNKTNKFSQPVDVIQEKFNDFINYIILMYALSKGI